MKVLTILFAALLICFAAMPTHAQSPVKKGKWMVDGSVGFQSQSGDYYENSEGDSRTTIFLSPEAMYFFMDNFGIGAVLDYSTTSRGDNTQSSLSVGPRIAYFFKTGNPKWLPFLGAGIAFGSTTSDDGTNDFTISNTIIALSGGIMMVITENVGVSGAISYRIESYKADGADDSVDGNILGVLFGFHIFLP